MASQVTTVLSCPHPPLFIYEVRTDQSDFVSTVIVRTVGQWWEVLANSHYGSFAGRFSRVSGYEFVELVAPMEIESVMQRLSDNSFWQYDERAVYSEIDHAVMRAYEEGRLLDVDAEQARLELAECITLHGSDVNQMHVCMRSTTFAKQIFTGGVYPAPRRTNENVTGFSQHVWLPLIRHLQKPLAGRYVPPVVNK